MYTRRQIKGQSCSVGNSEKPENYLYCSGEMNELGFSPLKESSGALNNLVVAWKNSKK